MKTSEKDPDVENFLASLLEEEKKDFREGVQTFGQHAKALSHEIYAALDEYHQSYENGLQAYQELTRQEVDEDVFSTAEELDFFDAVEEGASIWALLGFSFDGLIQFYEALSNLFEANEYRKVKDGFIFLTTVASDISLFWTGLGIVLTKLQEYPQAQGAFEEALQLDPSSVDAYLGLIHLFVKQKQFLEAANICDQGIAYVARNNTVAEVQGLHALLEETKKMLVTKGASS